MIEQLLTAWLRFGICGPVDIAGRVAGKGVSALPLALAEYLHLSTDSVSIHSNNSNLETLTSVALRSMLEHCDDVLSSRLVQLNIELPLTEQQVPQKRDYKSTSYASQI